MTPQSAISSDPLAHVLPHRSVLQINAKTYRDARQSWMFGLYGLLEELIHTSHVASGHVRTMRLLERDNQDALMALITGQEDIATVKERIVHNELACRHIARASQDLVEARDQFLLSTYFAEWQSVKEELTSMDYRYVDNWKKQVDARGTVEGERYHRLERLAEKFGTPRIPRYAAFLALNIPLPAMHDAADRRRAKIESIDIDARFDTVSNALMNDVDPPPDIPPETPSGNGLVALSVLTPGREKWGAFFDDLSRQLSIDTELQARGRFLPLLDIPYQRAPEPLEIIVDNLPDVLTWPLALQELSFDAGIAFGSLGCVTICTDAWRPIGHLSNPYVLSEMVGAQTYLDYLVESLAVTGVVDQLIASIQTYRTDALHCPLCDADHDYRDGNCSWDAALGTDAMAHAHPDRWIDYQGKTAAVQNEFVITPVPGEERLTAG